MTVLPSLSIAVGEILGLGSAEVVSIRPLIGGRNNRVYHVTAGDRDFLLKSYYRDANDSRDRLGTEFGFARYLWGRGLRSLPEPIAADRERGLALFGFMPGRRLEPSEVSSDRVGEAMSFIRNINRHRQDSAARALPKAAEACFALADHIELVDRRRLQLVTMPCQDALDREAQRFAAQDLGIMWLDAMQRIEPLMDRDTFIAAPLAMEHRCLSPSDFGFHNALVLDDGQLIFHDFEYAGWDDPAKLMADFFRQVELPIPGRYWDQFAEELIAALELPDWHRRRIEIILPLYSVKWCCIVLNEFLPSESRRRRFAESQPDPPDTRRRQLELARHLVDRWQQ